MTAGFPQFRTTLRMPTLNHEPRRPRRETALLRASYERRECFICRLPGFCSHRERDMELEIALSSYGPGGRL